jgi:sulfofructose kinase
VVAGSETHHQAAFPVPVKDTTGAGDVFHGAFLYALLQDWNLRRCVTFAAAVAALKCRALGGRAGIPTLPEALAFLGWE